MDGGAPPNAAPPAPPVLGVADRLDIHELLGLYGHLIDDRAWSRMDEVFTDDVVLDLRDFGEPDLIHGRAELVRRWSLPGVAHPLAHHATNIVFPAAGPADAGPDEVAVLSKGLGVGPGGRVGSIVYRDVVRRTPAGWRIARRTATLRRPESPTEQL